MESGPGQPEHFARGDEHGQSLLSQISNEMVQAMKQYFGKGPTRAKSYMLDDFLIIVMRGGTLPAERTLVEGGREEAVRTFRQEFQDEMEGPLVAKIEELTGRKIINYQSQILFDPDMLFEIFVFDSAAQDEEVSETAAGQLEDRTVGEATLDVPAER